MDEKKKNPEGNCIISEDVVVAIASTAAQEVAGVAGMASRTANLRGLMKGAKPVRVVNNENETILDLYLNLFAGVNIQQTAGEVQRAVKTAVQSMIGKPVTRVNVHVMGIVFENEAK
ncbi:MAG: Asp23/Gls24 family envelope stress response protein [Clostridia bacterium]|nr:Asp23/Gls24 family envelope stress response protein [Clostridia bacterium]